MFIGGRSIILYDVTIGDNVIIGAGSVVTRDIPSGSVVAGCPAESLDDFRIRWSTISDKIKTSNENETGCLYA